MEEEGQLVAKLKISGSNQPTEKFPIGQDSPLRQYMMAGNVDKASWDEETRKNEMPYHAKYHRYFEPQLLCTDSENKKSVILAYTSVTFPED